MKTLFGTVALFLCVTLASAAQVDDLVKQLKAAEADKRREAAEAIGKVGKEAKAAAPALIAALKDSDLFVRVFAAQSLGEIDADPKTAVPALAAALRDKKEVQETAIVSLRKLGAAAVPTLADVAKDPGKEGSLRRKAIESLGQLKDDAKSTVPMLTELVSGKTKTGKPAMNRDVELRVTAVNSLGEIATAADSETVKLFTDMIAERTTDRQLRAAMQKALPKIKNRK
jgi:HEAT repeat protein